ncbi:hypothetical protein SCHPADRAFT_299202 [Schizopora paradoxa]|uniref:Fungal-type protein kinase domain-containing protein n=1 Tax=Schizopora paradoxa TaxID=27342 RepID=A0A0H2SCS9_9AGAM|nr:hypothetical protein SCHPADRAFT_299202 [Schizopora paradoxa]
MNLKGHTWQFPPDDITRMLSPKVLQLQYRNQPRDEVTGFRHLLIHFDSLIDHPTVVQVMDEVFIRPLTAPILQANEPLDYEPVADFLNQCISLCDIAYGKIASQLGEDGQFTVKARTDRWLVTSFGYDRQVGDKIRGAHPLKPKFVEGSDTACWWKVPVGEKGMQMHICSDLKAEWPDIILQCATYARGQFYADPLRSFVVVIAVNHKSSSLRVLIFHHGGLSASREFFFGPNADEGSHRAFLKILLSIFLWQGPADAGLPEFTDGETWVLPSKTQEHTVATQTSILFYRPSIRSRETFVALLNVPGTLLLNEESEAVQVTPSMDSSASAAEAVGKELQHIQLESATVPGRNVLAAQKTDHQNIYPLKFLDHEPSRKERNYLDIPSGDLVAKCSWPSYLRCGVEEKVYESCRGDFGTPTLYASYEPFTSNHHCMTNSFFLPPPGSNLSVYFFPIWNEETAREPDYRSLVVSLSRDRGKTIDNCESAWDLCIFLLHSMLGWLSMFQSGYMHRDVSIGNLFMLPKEVEMEPFSIKKFTDFRNAMLGDGQPTGIRQEIQDKVQQLRTLQQQMGDKFTEAIEKVARIAAELERKVTDDLRVTKKCRAIISDGDLAAYIPTYFTKEHGHGELSGTTEFMSPSVIAAVARGGRYLHKPIDDMYSFLFVALWATVLHPKSRGTKPSEAAWKHHLLNNARIEVLNEWKREYFFDEEDEDGTYSHLVLAIRPILREWVHALDHLDQEFTRAIRNKDPLLGNPLLLYDEYAYRGVTLFVDILIKHFASSKDVLETPL